ncbi:MAG: methyltransferase domain-containing protein, partial [Burkholderiaceae bacterium]
SGTPARRRRPQALRRRVMAKRLRSSPLAGGELVSAAIPVDDGYDPLGSDYCARNDARSRRRFGVTLTPRWLVDLMVARAAARGPYTRVLDVGCGTARFALAAARAFPQAATLGVELQPELAVLARRSIAESGLSHRIAVVESDFSSFELAREAGPTLFIGNPPYVRHHDLTPEAKARYRAGLAELGISGSLLAGLHAHFLLRIAQLAQPGDVVCLVLPAEWLDTNYGRAMRELWRKRLGLAELWVANPDDELFRDAMVSSVVALGVVGARVDSVAHYRLHPEVGADDRPYASVALGSDARWSVGETSSSSMSDANLEIGRVFQVRRGQVTGNNKVWVHGMSYAAPLPEAVLTPCITRGRELLDLAEPELSSLTKLKRLITIPAHWQNAFKDEPARQIAEFLSWAQDQGVAEGYIASHRSPWYSVRLPKPAPIVMTYMARRAPRFVLNSAGAGLLNIAHGLYPRVEMAPAELRRAVVALNAASDVRAGRSYAGKLVKFEPSDAMRMKFKWSE